MDTYANTTPWDCGSTLYDSFELKSFNLQLNSAIASSPRTLSMSCLPDRRAPSVHQLQPQPQPHTSSSAASKKPFKISRSLQKLLRSVFKPNNNNSNNNKSSVSTSSMISSSFVQVPEKYSNNNNNSNEERFYVVYDKSGGPTVLSTIPEVPEFEITSTAPSPEEISSFVSRSASERFAATTAIGISCP
ncbi:hypothetical protein PIB30_038759 [Stylosanthes scabra]|uniref:Uncharacterized protein n=1 Tax=Stylosanthes scabra TaxID=79078 RepID=A0ABU6WCF8_9FABA|nr:hypothetical protein [Stylosanthes scabra]